MIRASNVHPNERLTNNMTINNMTDGNNTRALVEFKDSINEHIDALHTACRDFFGRQGESNKPVPREIQIDIRSGMNRSESPARALANDERSECWDYDYICGKYANGDPIYCSVLICIIVGPVTVES